MKVICIKNNTGFDLNGIETKENSLTLGKVYETARSRWEPLLEKREIITYEQWLETSDLIVMNDNGILSWYNRSTLVPLDKFRELKLEEIGIV